MDRLVYTAMSGAKALEQRQHALSNNLANASTDGFRADTTAFRSVPLRAEGSATTRVFSLEATAGFNDATGPIRKTDRPMDVAIRGDGWFAVKGPDGAEAYTRNGSFVVGPEGTLLNQSGHAVVGDGGAISIPENAQVVIGSDGTVSARVGNQPSTQVGQLKLVNPDSTKLTKSSDGLYKTIDGQPVPVDETVRVASGALEGSNVNVVEAMIGMISVSRQFDMQMRMIQNAESNESRAASILSRNG
jgi:flagellar basal-body rod protein FlgF